MKTSEDPRHKERVSAVKQLFAQSFTDQSDLAQKTKNVLENTDIIDQKIREAAPAWPLKKLNKIDLAVLRLAVYELTNTKTPPKVVIDEAIEIAKKFGSEKSPSFVNGVLGTIYQEKNERS